MADGFGVPSMKTGIIDTFCCVYIGIKYPPVRPRLVVSQYERLIANSSVPQPSKKLSISRSASELFFTRIFGKKGVGRIARDL